MQDSFSIEKKYIELIKVQIIKNNQNKSFEQWQQRDFENLSQAIDEKTGVLLSVSTLKRLWKNQFSTIPQKNTLNALAQFQGYKDWFDFKDKNPLTSPHKPVLKQKGSSRIKLPRKLLYIPATLIVLFVALVFILNSQPAQSYEEATFSSRKNVSSGLPNTVIFDYDITMYDFDSAFIQQSWDIRRRARIEKDKMNSTSVYYYPGYHRAKLLINNQLVREIPVYITTNGWLSVIRNPKNELIPIYVNDNCIDNGKIQVSKEQLLANNIDLEANNHKTTFYFVNEEFYGDSDNFTFSTRIKNDINDDGQVCQLSEISILCESGRHFVFFSDPGCVGRLGLSFGQEYVSGKNHDLSKFGTNLNNWNDIEIKAKDRIVNVTLNGNNIYKGQITKSVGKIKGVFYNFQGRGAVDYAKLYDHNDQLIFTEEFD